MRNISPRQRRVLELLAEGLERAEIALRMKITTHTVGTHAARLKRVIGTRTCAGAVAYALRNGIIK